MKKMYTIILVGITTIANADAGRGAFFGGLTGATLGGAFGGGRGAGIGAAVGLATGAIAGAASDRDGGYEYSSLDSANASYWDVTNRASFPILVRASGTSTWFLINPEQTTQVPRNRSFKIYAKHADDKKRRPRSATIRNHSIEIGTSDNGSFLFDSWN